MIARQECHELAALSRLAPTDEDAERFAPQLERILGYLRRLEQIDVAGVPEFTLGGEGEARLRPDEAGPVVPHEAAMDSAPEARDGSFAVPKFMDTTEG